MKKLFAILIIATIVLSSNIALAQSNKEIRFREIEWGTTFGEIRKTASEYGDEEILKGEEDYPGAYSTDTIVTTNGAEFEYNTGIKVDYNESPLKVAGYDVDAVNLFFAYDVQDGDKDTDDEDALLYGARYEIVPANMDSAFDELKMKLTDIYGKPDDSGIVEDDFGGKRDWIVWYGENNTGVALTKDVAEEGTIFALLDAVKIAYFTKDGDEWLQASSDYENEKGMKDRENDNSGL